jgi:hypothetical protein
MLWTGPPPARECQVAEGVTCFALGGRFSRQPWPGITARMPRFGSCWSPRRCGIDVSMNNSMSRSSSRVS